MAGTQGMDGWGLCLGSAKHLLRVERNNHNAETKVAEAQTAVNGCLGCVMRLLELQNGWFL
ncbi:MAG: hypothetical protein IPL28_18080 [Chloroflexi bacterium]|nr:hypothetical protein [Chloroflexota bacterium]